MRLHELHINNFKFFPKQDPESPLLKIDGKNLLIYGENGSGKSTIYWAIYTLLESAFKNTNEDISKYFIKGKEFSLVNIHSKKPHNPYIKTLLKEAGQSDKRYLISSDEASIETARNSSEIRESAMASDFINYRVIFRLHHVKHSKSNDLFPWFADEIFPYITKGSNSCITILRNLESGPNKVKDKEGVDIFPNKSMINHPDEVIRKYSHIYKKYTKELSQFNKWLEAFLKSITLRANEIIKNDFDFNFEINLKYSPAKEQSSDTDLNWTNPVITLTIPKYENKTGVIFKPHSFLNEAKWSAIGLAIRFAILEDWTNRPASAELKCLVIDDMLLSLDMSNRDIVMDLLLNKYVNEYQIILMTHDRFFYELMSQKIIRKGQTNQWKYLEMYEDDNNGTSKPHIIENKGQIDKAKIFYKAKEFAASANTIRRATEKLCKHYLTKQEQLGGDYTPLKLEGLINSFITKGTANGLDANKLSDLKDYKDRIMNPSSHYDIETQIFKNELKKAIATIEFLANQINVAI